MYAVRFLVFSLCLHSPKSHHTVDAGQHILCERMRLAKLQAVLSSMLVLHGPCSSSSPHAQAKLHNAGKLAVLEALLARILDGERLRCVLVSSSTAALDIAGNLCAARGWGTVRIDGATNLATRQEVVDGFNLYNRGQACANAASTS